ncbi:MAG: 50S ribosomal protein L3 N(5)-glutamine methyltransferase [Alcanivorax sp.]|jgi:ribosomal protein L3 glutamine methyltransferase|nr:MULTISPECIES: 50S ribosomal protein L3 N(5)-glutamine methyltransferase [unclassified Ketobacter]MCK5790748.1 50S ribosomal protein L3 N(5)-glutamine methyltransferase [Ketobacter sp.]MEC8811003.1 50S ribosomal protein L3 N(5)-glutamine methyltransferase [Pseudomonadota bacterium]RLT89037.1 MAG: 50S ribosomal protein L3 N(5)-glutamine methyltransferase [Ketobacter sp. GenoA1]TNC88733.1 MAG: 50S ribosomal protein L3 N(5)-glutamine methyltransferase [Alcanivorax sp.]RLT97177.1 MAG: 50S riboso|tara:strand:- start:1188 stop:2138 length:951 start_codon:yes stop_codon:yes gene_type:complete
MVAIPDSSQDLLSIDEAISELATIRDFLRWSVSLFNEHQLVLGHGFDDPWDEAVALVLHALHLPWDTDVRIQDARVLPAERKVICSLLARRVLERVPTAYLTGVGWFAGIPFQVDQRVLIPRSPIGELIEKQFAPWIDPAAVESILDLCTGSGCIGIACAQYFPDALVDCADLSEDALDVAERNVLDLGFEQQVNVIYSDLFEALDGRTYDIIVSNPPYVDKQDMDALADEFHHEPRMGLEAGNDGLDIVRKMLPELSRHLNPGGIAVIEVGNSWEALEDAYPQVGFTWLEFERGGMGVFLLTKEQIDHHQADFVL